MFNTGGQWYSDESQRVLVLEIGVTMVGTFSSGDRMEFAITDADRVVYSGVDQAGDQVRLRRIG
jgi:hypothetical protein